VIRPTNPDPFNDDHAGFDRPGRRSRPRTKERPDYSDRPVGRVVTIDRGRYHCLVDELAVTATKARLLGRKAVIVGDLVRLDADVSGQPGSLARIVQVLDRTTVLRRTADDDDPFERPIVANADQLVVVTSLADPEPKVGMIDRVLVSGFDAGLEAVLCLTKSDLARPDELVAAYLPLDVSVFVLSPGCDLEPLSRRLTDHVSVLVGHSGVGKSTLVNALIPGTDRATAQVSQTTGRGRHTSTSAIALPLPAGGWVIDTPGVRSFGLSHVRPDRVVAAFSDLAAIAQDCPRGCGHGAEEPECALDQAVRQGLLAPQRLASFRRIEAAGRPR
jgi:ribosome biogenesis GTPase